MTTNDLQWDAAGAARDSAIELAESEQPVAAVPMYVRAGELSAEANNFSQAARDFERALELTDDLASLGDVRRRYAEVLLQYGRPEAAVVWQGVAEDSRSLEDPDGCAFALFNAHWEALDDVGSDLLDAAIAADPGGTGWAARARASRLAAAGRFGEALVESRIALQHARATGNTQLEAHALHSLANSIAYSGDIAGGVIAQRHAIQCAQHLGDRRLAVIGRMNLVQFLMADLRYNEIVTELDQLEAQIDASSVEIWRTEAGAIRALHEAVAGGISRAHDRTQAMLVDAQSHGSAASCSFVASIHAQILVERGSFRDAVAIADLSDESAVRNTNDNMIYVNRLHRARAACGLGAYEEALELLAALPDGEMELLSAGALEAARIARIHGFEAAVDTARQLLARVDDPSDPRVMELVRQCVRETIVTLDDDRDQLADIATNWESVGMPLYAWRTRVALGASLARDRRVVAANAILDVAHRTLVSMGAAGDADVAARLRAEIGTGDPKVTKVLTIAECQSLDGLAPEAVEAVIEQARTDRYAAGDVIFNCGDLGNDILILLSGRVSLFRSGSDDRRIVIGLVDAGETFGEAVLVANGAHDCGALAQQNCVVARLPADRFRRLLQRYPKIADNHAEALAQRLTHSRELSHAIAFDSVQQRLKRLLVELDNRYGHPTLTGTRVVNAVFTQEELGEMIGATRVAVAVQLKALRASGVVTLNKRRIEILIPDELVRLDESASEPSAAH